MKSHQRRHHQTETSGRLVKAEGKNLNELWESQIFGDDHANKKLRIYDWNFSNFSSHKQTQTKKISEESRTEKRGSQVSEDGVQQACAKMGEKKGIQGRRHLLRY